jgi:uncharacterized protein YaiI (UPF0178 family)
MKLLLDGDSCPTRQREILIKAVFRTQIQLIVASDRELPIPDHDLIEKVIVEPGENAADERLLEYASEGDICISRDVPLAKQMVEKGVVVIDDRGEIMDEETIGQRLSIRNFLQDMRETGIMVNDGRGAISQKDIQNFAAALDRELTKRR